MKYAIVESGGKQYKAVEGATIDVDLLTAEPNQNVALESVLLVVDGDRVEVGTPSLTGASVAATVVGHVKGPKLAVVHYRPKRRIRTKTGHRQTYTRLMINSIEME